MEKNEMIISLYDYFYSYSVKINGITQENDYDIALEYHYAEPDRIIEFMTKYNIHRLIVCEDGDINIYTR